MPRLLERLLNRCGLFTSAQVEAREYDAYVAGHERACTAHLAVRRVQTAALNAAGVRLREQQEELAHVKQALDVCLKREAERQSVNPQDYTPPVCALTQRPLIGARATAIIVDDIGA